jgi:hypothetical protein
MEKNREQELDGEQSLIRLLYLFEILPRINPKNDTQEKKD